MSVGAGGCATAEMKYDQKVDMATSGTWCWRLLGYVFTSIWLTIQTLNSVRCDEIATVQIQALT